MTDTPIEELDVKGIGPSTIKSIKTKGYTTIEELGKASRDEISEVDGLGDKYLHRLLMWLYENDYRDRGKYQQEKERLQQRLQEIFQLETAEDLDFGTAKVINMHRDEIEDYINYELIPTVESEVERIVEEYEPDELEQKRETIEENIGQEVIQDDGTISPEHRGIKIVDEYIKLREDVITKRDARRIMADVLSYIGDFFTRYYDNGDFIYQERQRAKGSEYSIPYSGSETNFYWSTKNQYYARTSDYYENYRFNSKHSNYKYVLSYEDVDGGDSDGYIMESPSGIEVNKEDKIVKAQFKRREAEDGEIQERYDQSTHTEKTASEVHAEEIVSEVEKRDEEYAENIDFVQENIRDFITETNFDFFIHKSLGDFLSKELDSFVKNEVLEYESGNYAGTNYKEHVATVFYDASESVIELLSRIEEYKKSAYEKTKFVKNREELVQLKNIPEENYDIILENEDQLAEWKESLNVEVFDLTTPKLSEQPYSEMMVDTRYFDEDITAEKESRNKLVKADNYQALNLLKQKYRDSVKCIYIDPPYNTGNANFAYKDNYQRPTWLSIMHDRLNLAKTVMKQTGVIFVSIDDNEFENMKHMLDNIFGEDNRLQTIIWDNNSGMNRGYFRNSHEYVLAYCKDKSQLDYFQYRQELRHLANLDSGTIVKRAIHTSPSRTVSRRTIEFPAGRLNCRGEDRTVEEGEKIGPETNPIIVEEGDLVIKDNKNRDSVKLSGFWSAPHQTEEWAENGVAFDRSGQKIKEYFVDESNMIKHKKVRTQIRPNSIQNWPSTQIGTDDLKSVFGEVMYSHPKPVKLVKDCVNLVTDDGDTVLDFFAGSGTTAQAVQELNRERDEQVNYIMVEMLDEAFDITTERVKRTAYSKEWDDGNPQVSEEGLDTNLSFDAEILELESYNETLETLLHNQSETKDIFDYDEELLDYSLDFDKALKQNLIQLGNPVTENYKVRSENGLQEIDMETTFNYLIGLREIETDEVRIDGTECTVYTGFNGDREKVKVVWRGGEVDHREEKNKIEYDSFDHVFINGDSAIPNAQSISENLNSILTQGDKV